MSSSEAREFALLQDVVDDEAEADGERDEAGCGDGEHFAHLQDLFEKKEERDEAEAEGDEDDGGAAGVAERAHRIPGCGLASTIAGDGALRAASISASGDAAGEHGHALLGA